MAITIEAPATAASPATRTRPRLVLAISCMSLLIAGMDVTIVNVALPSIQSDLDASVSSLQWTTAAYTVVLASLLMLGGSTADRLGRARVFEFGLAAIALTARFVPESRAPRPRRPDPVGQVLVIVTLASLTSAIIEGPGLGWDSPLIVALALTAGVSLVALVRYDGRGGKRRLAKKRSSMSGSTLRSSYALPAGG